MRIYTYAFTLLVFALISTSYAANTNSTNQNATGYSTIIINITDVMPNYQSGNISFVVFPLSNISSYTTLELLNQSSFSKYNLSIQMVNNSGYPPFVGYIRVSPTIHTPSNMYRLYLRAIGGNPTNFTEIVNLTILNRTLYGDYLGIERAMNNVSNPNSTSITTAPITQKTTSVQNFTTSIPPAINTTTYLNTTTISNTTGTSEQQSSPIGYALLIIIIIGLLGAAYAILRRRRTG